MRIRLALLLFLFGCSAQAKIIHIESGTGFYIDTLGHVVTNAHVVPKCRFYSFKTGQEVVKAHLVKADPKRDLAVLQANTGVSPASAVLHEQLAVGDKVTILGYPIQGKRSSQLFRRNEAAILNVSPKIQFTRSVEKGNSGGPLLDTFGNVVGVIQSKMRERPIDIAIPISVLKQFLDEAQINYSTVAKIEPLTAEALEAQRRVFITNVRCVR